jgi:hypothetical protein
VLPLGLLKLLFDVLDLHVQELDFLVTHGYLLLAVVRCLKQ